MILSDDVLFVCPDTSFVQAFGAWKSPPGFPARPPDPPVPLELPETLELFAPPPIPLEVEDSALPPPPVVLLLSLGPHAEAEVTIHATSEAEVVIAQGASFVWRMSRCTRFFDNTKEPFFAFSNRQRVSRDGSCEALKQAMRRIASIWRIHSAVRPSGMLRATRKHWTVVLGVDRRGRHLSRRRQRAMAGHIVTLTIYTIAITIDVGRAGLASASH